LKLSQVLTVNAILFIAVGIGFIIITVTPLTQQASVWGSIAGWILTAVFVVFALIYIYFHARKEM
jgi:hypothetical protein